MRLMCLFFGLLFGLTAQDASLVLQTSVSHDSLAASTPMPPEKKAEVQKLRQQAGEANAAKNYSEALRHLHHGMMLIRGGEWTPAASLGASLVLEADHAVWEPGQKIQLRMKRLYAPDEGAPQAIDGSILLRRGTSGELIQAGSWKIEGETPAVTITVPEGVTGRWRLEVAVPPLPQPKLMNVAIEPGLRSRVEKLDARIAKLKMPAGSALWSAKYSTEVFRLADRSQIQLTSVDLPAELARGEALTKALESGSDPLAMAKGDIRLAYLSKVDNTLQPYRLFVPSAYDREKPLPLIVALHGMGGDENTLFDRYGNEAIEKLAEANGYLVAAPKGRDTASMYRGTAGQDVFDVLAQVRSDYKVDANRIYMMGHSMGGFGTWSLAMEHPEIFAALAPVAGGADPRGMLKIRSIPQYVVHGDNDKTVNVQSSRTMVEAGRKLGAEIKFVEVPDGGHNDVVVPALPGIFEWFNTHPKKSASATATQ